MKFHVLTLFPEMIRQGMDTSILKRAMDAGKIELNCVNIRDFTTDKHGSVDDYPYGGGAGMLMQAQPVYDAWKSISSHDTSKTIYVSPKGKTFNQRLAERLAEEEELIFLCGHYEGIDERALEKIGVECVSIGDYVLTGGELPAMVMMDCISRLVPGVLNNQVSAETESFQGDLLEYPQYSRPEVWEDMEVPKVLLGGNHKDILAWQKENAIELTKKCRPDLYNKFQKKTEALKVLGKSKRENACIMDILLTGDGDLIAREGNSFLAFHRGSRYTMLFGDSVEEGLKLLSHVPSETYLLCTNIEGLLPELKSRKQFVVFEECYQVVYTNREKMAVSHKNIRVLTMEDLPYVSEHYGNGEACDYLKQRIIHGAMYGAYVEDKLVGFCGMHKDGSIGMLYVEPEHRLGHIGSSLASFMVNISMERGGLPYAHIYCDNEPSLKMVDSMGLYQSKKVIYWLEKEK